MIKLTEYDGDWLGEDLQWSITTLRYKSGKKYRAANLHGKWKKTYATLEDAAKGIAGVSRQKVGLVGY